MTSNAGLYSQPQLIFDDWRRAGILVATSPPLIALMNPTTTAFSSSSTRVPALRAGLATIGLLLGPSVRAQDGSARPPPPASGPAIFSGSMTPPDYPIPYRTPTVEEITAVMSRVRAYLEVASPARVINRKTREEITDFSKPDPDAGLDRGENNAFLLISYENGVTYAGMLLAGEVTGDARFTDFTARRFQFIADRLPYFRMQYNANPNPMERWTLRSMIAPHTLDDAGAMCAAMIKARRAGVGPDLLPVINTYIEHISHKQFRLADGTLARTNPQPETLWLDDMYMSIPALAQMGKLTGEAAYYDDAVRQVLQFSARMFNRQKGLYMHGWSSNTPDHPEFYWARANGWAAMAMVELLEVLPEDHPHRTEVIDLLRAHLKGLAACQADIGLWHQLLDRPDSYLETSASAMYVFSMARAINRGWISPVAFGPAAQLGWNAVATKVNARGQVEDTCVGTGMAFDPTYYYHRPRSAYAQHGYGPVLMAGAEMIRLLKNDNFTIAPGIIQYIPKNPKP
jgi:rhamnogalacturonyl hydrolase YesR